MLPGFQYVGDGAIDSLTASRLARNKVCYRLATIRDGEAFSGLHSTKYFRELGFCVIGTNFFIHGNAQSF